MDKLFIESRLSADGEALWPRVTGGLAGGAIAGVGGKFSYIKKGLGKMGPSKVGKNKGVWSWLMSAVWPTLETTLGLGRGQALRLEQEAV